MVSCGVERETLFPLEIPAPFGNRHNTADATGLQLSMEQRARVLYGN